MELSYARPKAMSEKGGAAAAVSALTAKAKLAGMWREKDAWVAADVVRIEDGKLAEHWDVLQDEATQAQSASGLPMFGDRFPE